jgi:hypothetical protein
MDGPVFLFHFPALRTGYFRQVPCGTDFCQPGKAGALLNPFLCAMWLKGKAKAEMEGTEIFIGARRWIDPIVDSQGPDRQIIA